MKTSINIELAVASSIFKSKTSIDRSFANSDFGKKVVAIKSQLEAEFNFAKQWEKITADSQSRLAEGSPREVIGENQTRLFKIAFGQDNFKMLYFPEFEGKKDYFVFLDERNNGFFAIDGKGKAYGVESDKMTQGLARQVIENFSAGDGKITFHAASDVNKFLRGERIEFRDSRGSYYSGGLYEENYLRRNPVKTDGSRSTATPTYLQSRDLENQQVVKDLYRMFDFTGRFAEFGVNNVRKERDSIKFTFHNKSFAINQNGNIKVGDEQGGALMPLDLNYSSIVQNELKSLRLGISGAINTMIPKSIIQTSGKHARRLVVNNQNQRTQ